MIKIKINKDMENKFITNMIKNNNINAIIPFIIKEDNLIIEDNNLITLKDKLSGLIESKNLLILLDKLFKSVEIINKYMIEEDYISCDLDKVFLKNDNIYLLVNPFIEESKNIRDLFFEILMNYKIDENNFDMRLIKLKNELIKDDYDITVLRKIINDNINYKETREKKIKEKTSSNKKENNINIIKLIKEKFNKKDERIIKEHDLDTVFKFPKKS